MCLAHHVIHQLLNHHGTSEGEHVPADARTPNHSIQQNADVQTTGLLLSGASRHRLSESPDGQHMHGAANTSWWEGSSFSSSSVYAYTASSKWFFINTISFGYLLSTWFLTTHPHDVNHQCTLRFASAWPALQASFEDAGPTNLKKDTPLQGHALESGEGLLSASGEVPATGRPRPTAPQRSRSLRRKPSYWEQQLESKSGLHATPGRPVVTREPLPCNIIPSYGGACPCSEM